MAVPLVLLAIAAVLGGGINFPAWHLNFLSHFLSPIFPVATAATVSTGTKWALSVLTTAVALTGLGLGLTTWRTAAHPKLEPKFLRKAWYFDDIVRLRFPARCKPWQTRARLRDGPKVVDGAVNGVASSSGLSGRVLRKLQNGYIRSYALGIGVGLVVVLVYLTFRTGN